MTAAQRKYPSMLVRLASLFLLGLGSFWLVGVFQQPLPAEPGPESKDPLVQLNQAFRKAYASNRTIILAHTSPIVIASGDDLILYREGKRTEVKVTPTLYDDLKAIAHVPLAIYALLAPGRIPSEEYQTELRNYRNLVLATRDGIDQRWQDPKTLARQKEILDSSLRFLQEVLHPEKDHQPDLPVYCRRMGLLVLANANDAARAEIDATHAQMMRWKKELSREEWSRLQVIVIGSQMPRRGNLDVQYFAHLLGLKGEGPRLTYAEGLWEEPAALRLLGTRLADQEPGRLFFNDDQRLARDLLADGATEYLQTFKVEP
jgi:hypothetical protein